MMKNQKLVRSIAQERITTLLDMAKARTMKMRQSDELAKRYVNIAQAMATHYRIPRTQRMKYEVCKACKSVLVPGVNCTVRLAGQVGYVAIKCRCAKETHVFYKEQDALLDSELRKYNVRKL